MEGKRTISKPKAVSQFEDTIHGRLRAARKAKGLTQRKLADKIILPNGGTLNSNAISQWETGSRGPRDHLTALAIALEVSIEFLLTGVNPPFWFKSATSAPVLG